MKLGGVDGWGWEESRTDACCPRRVQRLWGSDRHLGGAVSIRMLPVRRQSFALLHTHPGEVRFTAEQVWTQRSHTYSHTRTHTRSHPDGLIHPNSCMVKPIHRRGGIYSWNIVNTGPLVHRTDIVLQKKKYLPLNTIEKQISLFI